MTGKLRKYQAGISYVEVVVAALLILISLIPMMDAMQGASGSVIAHEESAVRQAIAIARLEELVSGPVSELEAAIAAGSSDSVHSNLSDAIGTANRALIYLSYYDGDNADTDDDPFTGKDSDLLWVRVAIEDTGVAVETLVTK